MLTTLESGISILPTSHGRLFQTPSFFLFLLIPIVFLFPFPLFTSLLIGRISPQGTVQILLSCFSKRLAYENNLTMPNSLNSDISNYYYYFFFCVNSALPENSAGLRSPKTTHYYAGTKPHNYSDKETRSATSVLTTSFM